MTRKSWAAAVVAVLALGGCADLSDSQQRVLTGAGVGVASGAVITAITGGCIECGAAIGGAVGAATGYVVDVVKKNQEKPAAN
ncbi:MAG: hypothetical protein WCO00_05445 [Rhodospirillaceae bacterium]